MGSWYNTAWSHRWPIAVQILGGGGVAGNYDLQVDIPKEWDQNTNVTITDYQNIGKYT